MEKLELMNIIEEVMLKKELRECELRIEASNKRIRVIKDDSAYFEEKLRGLLKRQSELSVFNTSEAHEVACELESVGIALDELNRKLNKETQVNDNLWETVGIKKTMLDELTEESNKEEGK